MQTAQNQTTPKPEKIMRTFYIDREIAEQFARVVKKDMRNQSLVITNAMMRFVQSKT